MFVTDYTMHLLDHVKKIHFIGCGGSGMYPLIQILTAKGYDISGSDVLDGSIIRSEREMGVKVSLGHAADNVIGSDLVVYSAAIAKDNVELNAAASYGIPTVERSVLLGYVSRLYKDSICVSGTHGKTTTTSMITTALELAGRDPSAVIGGKLPLIGGYGKAGKGDVKLSNDAVNHVYKDSRGLVWIATREGLNVYDTRRHVFLDLSPVAEAKGNFIAAITEDQERNMWVSTSRKVIRVTVASDGKGSYLFDSRAYNSEDGLQNCDFNLYYN